jgi:hypothetical protein
MTFEEFFKKKRIDLIALQGAEPALFSEFKLHYTEMGEKSFDHTKKYWFNKIRRQFPLAIEVKTEKLKIDNPLAEQTITESLFEAKVASNLGFIPKFKAATTPQTAANQPKENTEETPATITPKPGFTPRFNIKNLPKRDLE